MKCEILLSNILVKTYNSHVRLKMLSIHSVSFCQIWFRLILLRKKTCQSMQVFKNFGVEKIEKLLLVYVRIILIFLLFINFFKKIR